MIRAKPYEVRLLLLHRDGGALQFTTTVWAYTAQDAIDQTKANLQSFDNPVNVEARCAGWRVDLGSPYVKDMVRIEGIEVPEDRRDQ